MSKEILCAECYKEKHSLDELTADDYVWYNLIKCDKCHDQPTIWFKKIVKDSKELVK